MIQEIRKAMSIDLLRMTNSRRPLPYVGIIFLVPIVMFAILGVCGQLDSEVGSGLFGGIFGLYFVLSWTLPYILATIDDAGEVRRLAGVMPVRRRRQIDGRFLLMVCLDIVFLLDCCVLLGMARFSIGPWNHAAFGGEWTELAVLVVALFACFVSIGSLLMPLTYRFHSQPALTWVPFAVMAGLCAVGLLVANLPANIVDPIMSWCTAHIFVAPWADILVILAVMAAVSAASLAVSHRIVDHWEF